MTVAELSSKIHNISGLEGDRHYLTYGGIILDTEKSLSSYDIPADVTLNLIVIPPRVKARKPIIYVFPPEETDVSLSLSLVPQWEFESVYPPPQDVDHAPSRTSIQWNVRARPDGSLTVKETGLEVSYLFWEAL